MSEKIDNLILEHLRAMRASIERVENAMDELRLRLGQVEEHIAGMRRDMSMLHADIAIIHKRLDSHDQRQSRIERRLELAE